MCMMVIVIKRINYQLYPVLSFQCCTFSKPHPHLASPIVIPLHTRTYQGTHYVCAGLQNGCIALYDQYLLQVILLYIIILVWITAQIEDEWLHTKMYEMGTGPISCMKRHHHKLYMCSGEEVLVVNIVDFTIQARWNATHLK